MPSFATKRNVGFTAAQMYGVVADIERYPEFLPLCTGLRVLSRSQKADAGGEELTARMSVGYKAIAESFTTRVVLKPVQPAIDVNYLDGPFKRLVNHWKFHDTGECRSEIDFYIDYEFRSAFLAVVMGSMFEQAFRRFSQAFEERARKIYGPS